MAKAKFQGTIEKTLKQFHGHDIPEDAVQLNVTRNNAILLQCHHCCGYYSDGKVDCEVVRCPLYPFMPYRKLEPDTNVFYTNPKRVGLTFNEPVDPERAEAARKRFAKAREKA